MRPFAGAFTQGGNLFTSLRLQQIRLRGLESNLGCIESHSFSASHPSCPQQWIVSRPLKAKTSCIKPGSSPEDVVKRVTKDDVEVNFARSGGPGGQNVNKLNTKVDMRLNVNDADWLSEDMLDSLQRLEKKRINKQGEFVITSQKTRSQANNVEDALEKLQASLDRAAESIIPAKEDPEKAKEINKRKRIANEKRVQNKKFNSERKASRGKVDY